MVTRPLRRFRNVYLVDEFSLLLDSTAGIVRERKKVQFCFQTQIRFAELACDVLVISRCLICNLAF